MTYELMLDSNFGGKKLPKWLKFEWWLKNWESLLWVVRNFPLRFVAVGRLCECNPSWKHLGSSGHLCFTTLGDMSLLLWNEPLLMFVHLLGRVSGLDIGSFCFGELLNTVTEWLTLGTEFLMNFCFDLCDFELGEFWWCENFSSEWLEIFTGLIAMLFADACRDWLFKHLGIDPLIAVPNIVGSSRILSSGRRTMCSSVLKVFVVAEHRIKPIEFAASVWSTSKEFGSANGCDNVYGVVWVKLMYDIMPSTVTCLI